MDKYYQHSKSLYNSVTVDQTKEVIDFDDKSIQSKRSAESFQNIFIKANADSQLKSHKIQQKSDDKNRFEVGIQVLSSSYLFWLKFFMYDSVSEFHDYPIARSFSKIYTPTVELVITFPNQVMLSTKRPEGEVRIDQI